MLSLAIFCSRDGKTFVGCMVVFGIIILLLKLWYNSVMEGHENAPEKVMIPLSVVCSPSVPTLVGGGASSVAPQAVQATTTPQVTVTSGSTGKVKSAQQARPGDKVSVEPVAEDEENIYVDKGSFDLITNSGWAPKTSKRDKAKCRDACNSDPNCSGYYADGSNCKIYSDQAGSSKNMGCRENPASVEACRAASKSGNIYWKKVMDQETGEFVRAVTDIKSGNTVVAPAKAPAAPSVKIMKKFDNSRPEQVAGFDGSAITKEDGYFYDMGNAFSIANIEAGKKSCLSDDKCKSISCTPTYCYYYKMAPKVLSGGRPGSYYVKEVSGPKAAAPAPAPKAAAPTAKAPAVAAAPVASVKVISKNSRCGPNHGNTYCPPGQSCSSSEWCGNTGAHKRRNRNSAFSG